MIGDLMGGRSRVSLFLEVSLFEDTLFDQRIIEN